MSDTKRLPPGVVWGNIAPGFKDENRLLFTDEGQAVLYNASTYDLTPLVPYKPFDLIEERVAFEAEARTRGWDLTIREGSKGLYKDFTVQIGWSIWRARAQLEK